MNQKKKTRALVLMLLTGILLLMAGCRKKEQQQEEDTGYQIYYINKEETAVVTESYEPEAQTTEDLIDELLQQLKTNPTDTEEKSAIPKNVSVSSWEIENGQLSLHFGSGYQEMNRLYEILCRSAVVRTLCQIPEVESVTFFIGDNPLMNLDETPVGQMTADSFVENTGDEINTYTDTTLKLYFANKAGDKLVEEQVDVRYSSNMSVEKLVVEQLIRGPITKDVYPTIPPETKVLSVSVKDGICYVNLNDGFLEQGYDLTEAVPIYSIVNSLTEIPGISKVQILVNGETNRVYRESIRFDTAFERNLDLVEKDGQK